MSRGGRTKNRENESQRRCVVSGLHCEKPALIRFCEGPDGAVVPDIYAKLPGRGFWVQANREALEELTKRPALAARALKKSISVPPHLLSTIEESLLTRLLSLISLARKAGLVSIGFENTQKALAHGKVRALIQAVDGSAHSKAKVKMEGDAVVKITCLTGAEIGLAFGRNNVIHSALLPSDLTKRIIEESKRLAGLRKVEKGA